ncbi:MAG: 50S ribosomal protein L30 [Desulfovibrionaceae bacterium]|nr:50S ribosomal protein L30 [Desulfovibrionaceae bacterium]
MFKIRLVKSMIGCTPKQRDTLKALGLRRIRQEKSFEERPSVQGMIEKVKHLVEVTKS